MTAAPGLLMSLAVVQTPYGAVEIVRCRERGERVLLDIPIRIECPSGERRIGSAVLEAGEKPGDVPLRGTAADIFEVIPHQPVLDPEQVGQGRVAVQRLSGQRGREHLVGERMELGPQDVDRRRAQGGCGSQLAKQPLDIDLDVTEIPELAPKASQRSVQIPQRAAEVFGIGRELGLPLVL